jgi:N-methylhydantoinase B/acetone carboxylase alpha subunit
MLQGTAYRSERSHTLGRFLRNDDLMHNPMSGSPGLGDPLDRKPASLVKDVNDGVYSPGIVERVYGVVCVFDEASDSWKLEEKATQARRAEIRQDRRANSVPYEEFYERERNLVVEGKLIDPLKEMLRGSMAISSQWAREFREFWRLDEGSRL